MVVRIAPRKVGFQIEPLRHLLGDPPAGIRFVHWLTGRLTHGDKRTLHRGCDMRRIVALQVCRLRQNNIRIVGSARWGNVHHHQQLKLLDRLSRQVFLRNALQNVLTVNDPCLNGIGLAVSVASDQSLRQALWLFRRQRVPVASTVGSAFLGVGIGGGGISPALTWLEEDSTLAAISTKQAVKDRHGSGTLCVIAVPSHVTTRMNRNRGFGLGHCPCRLANLRGLDVRQRFRPFRREALHMIGEFLQAVRILLHIFFVVRTR